jgi:hypothetical protein
MDDTNAILLDGFGRVAEVVDQTLSGLTTEELCFRPSLSANSIAWLVWHLTRIQDDHIAQVAGVPQVWLDGWSQKFKLPFSEDATGWDQSAEEVALVRASGDLLLGYFKAVHKGTIAYIGELRAGAYDRVVDRRWNPPVTLGVRLMSVLSDDLQHAGQAAYIRGLLAQ